MLLADQEDKVIGKDHPLDWRHSKQKAFRKKQPDQEEENVKESSLQNSKNHAASLFKISDFKFQIAD
jgi:hypothetical protein